MKKACLVLVISIGALTNVLYAQDITPPINTITHVVGADGRVMFYVLRDSELVSFWYHEHAAGLDEFEALEIINEKLKEQGPAMPEFSRDNIEMIVPMNDRRKGYQIYIHDSSGHRYRIIIERIDRGTPVGSDRSHRMNQ